MLKVYRLLGQGLAPAAALHRAQAEMRRWNRNPYFWGAFVTYGDCLRVKEGAREGASA
jgi:CHAT domain-containing protein